MPNRNNKTCDGRAKCVHARVGRGRLGVNEQLETSVQSWRNEGTTRRKQPGCVSFYFKQINCGSTSHVIQFFISRNPSRISCLFPSSLLLINNGRHKAVKEGPKRYRRRGGTHTCMHKMYISRLTSTASHADNLLRPCCCCHGLYLVHTDPLTSSHSFSSPHPPSSSFPSLPVPSVSFPSPSPSGYPLRPPPCAYWQGTA